MEKKNWINPELLDLAVSETKNDSTKDFPHMFVCHDCWTHHYFDVDKCRACGSGNIKFEPFDECLHGNPPIVQS